MAERPAREGASGLDTLRVALEKYARSFPIGHVLFEEGDAGDRMYVISTGKVRILKRIGGEEITLALLSPGDFFGEMALLEGQPRSATAVVAVKDTVLIEVAQDAFGAMLHENGEIAMRMLRRLSQRLREVTLQVTMFLTDNGTSRALEVLSSLSGNPSDDGWRMLPDFLDAPFLGARAGLPIAETREVLERLEGSGLIEDRSGRFHLAPEDDVAAFRSYLELKRRYDPLTVRELSEMTGLEEADVHRIIKRLLSAKLSEEGDSSALVDTYKRYLALKRRFEYPES
jgi:CRP-like cAMP-binding protein